MANVSENINDHFIALLVVGMQNLSATIIGYKLLKHTFILLLEHKLIETTIATVCIVILCISFYKLYLLINNTFELLVEHKRTTTAKIQEQDKTIKMLEDSIKQQYQQQIEKNISNYGYPFDFQDTANYVNLLRMRRQTYEL